MGGAMGVEYLAPEFFPQTCAIHTCRCGRSASVHGRHADELPEGWALMDGETEICAECVEARAETPAAADREPPA